jgi:hypothetical protein
MADGHQGQAWSVTRIDFGGARTEPDDRLRTRTSGFLPVI